MDRVTAKCKNCVYFEYRDVPETIRRKDYFFIKDGYCTKIFPRGYVGAGKPGGWRCSHENTCFQFELKEKQTE